MLKPSPLILGTYFGRSVSIDGDVTVVTFPGAGHGFMNDRRRSYDREAAQKAWNLAVDFLREHLASP